METMEHEETTDGSMNRPPMPGDLILHTVFYDDDNNPVLAVGESDDQFILTMMCDHAELSRDEARRLGQMLDPAVRL